MAQLIINSGSYTVMKDNQLIETADFSANAVVVFEDGDFSMEKTPASTVWLDTDQPLAYTIVFTNNSETTLESIEIRDTMPVASEATPGLTLNLEGITAELVPNDGGSAVIDVDQSTATDLIVTAVSQAGDAIAPGATLTVTFNTTYVSPITP